ncbi:phage portal protein [Gluconobacter sp. LMG 31484]|uniref:Phage portal protein n=1 Tax=Gluconobacter vitians TaxID=2728102 RepID=A0ABR9Y648_9PROT|nr:phage portal protein [Gluconobacter vitians]MBF0859410.1 phage portal protein [Gluconobacter vitians]
MGIIDGLARAIRGTPAVRARVEPRLAPAATPNAPPRPDALNSPSNVPYDGADYYGQHMQNWNPVLWSGDTEIGPQRDTLVARVRDLVRNDGWAAGAVTRTLDNTVGVNIRPISKPDYRALAHMSGNKAFDAQWAREYGAELDSRWRQWANDPRRFNDAERMLTFGQQMHLAFRQLLTDGDAIATLPWIEERMGRGAAQYATAVKIIDPDRLSNPQGRPDWTHIRNGVEVDEHEAPIAYHIREAHQADYWQGGKTVTWKRIPRETDFGRPMVVHMFEHHRGTQHRGGAGILAPVIQRLKMLIRYDTAELDASIVNAIFAAFIESPYDHQMTAEALGSGSPGGSGMDGRWQQQLVWNSHRDLSMQGSRIPMLFPGEKINTVAAARPANGYRDFQRAVLNNVAAGAGLSPQQVSNDFSDVNYSSARAALLEAWKTLTRRRQDFEIGFCQPIRMAFVEESMEIDDLPLPRNAPEFMDARAAYARAKWLGPGRGWIDPVAEKQGAILGMDAGLSTLEQECATNEGADWEEVIDQRKIEVDAFTERGLALPEWTGQQEASATVRKPEET